MPPASPERRPVAAARRPWGGDRLLILLLAVVSFVPLVHGVFRRLHPLLLEELLELGQPHVRVLLLEARQVDLFKSREGGFHPALGMPVRIVGNAGGREFRQTCIKNTARL